MPLKRNRRKQTIPFAERLQQAATAARDAAKLLPAGQERDSLLKKALQAETAAHINELLSAPRLQPADRQNLPGRPAAWPHRWPRILSPDPGTQSRPQAYEWENLPGEVRMARIVVGTSGWHYASWRGAFFPSGLLIRHELPYYASQFETTELNGVFYRTPTEAAVRSWHDQTGPDFVFAWKASKFITHWKRLSARSVNSLELMESRLALLGDKAGPVLFQLPPQFQLDVDRLAGFLALLPRHRRYSFEFRHPSWYTSTILRLLRDANISLCLSDHHDAPAPWRRTADFVYVRGHGPGGQYRDNYPAATLEDWARRLRGWSAHGIDVYVYFDNDQKSAAPADALRLRALLERRRSRSPRLGRRSSAESRAQPSVQFPISDMFELQSNRLGEEKGNAQEKSFAAQTMKDHTKTSSELKLMVEPARSRCSDPRRSTARHDAEPRQGK